MLLMPAEEYIPQVRMEEEEESESQRRRTPIGYRPETPYEESPTDRPPASSQADLERILTERQSILTDPKLTPNQKLKLLESNRQFLVILKGGHIRKTENVVYGLLVFGGVLLVVLALLTVYAKLPSDITLSFVGTVLGGTIATIAQKLGRL